MKITATQKQIRQTPRKMRLVANQVKDLSLEKALRQLALIDRRASLAILKVLKQAIANAMNNHRLPFESLELKGIQINPGSVYKRWRAVSRGRAHSIMKRTSHIRVELGVKKVDVKSNKTTATPKKKIAKKVAVAKTDVKKTTTKKVTTKVKKTK